MSLLALGIAGCYAAGIDIDLYAAAGTWASFAEPLWLSSAAMMTPALWLRRFASRTDEAPSGSDPSPGRQSPLPAEVLDAIPNPFIIVDADDRVQAANLAVETVLGYAPESLVGSGLAETLLPLPYRNAYRARLQRYIDAGPTAAPASADSVRVVGADGAEIAVDLSVHPASGAERGLFGVCLRDARPWQEAEAARDAAEGWQRTLRTVVDAIPDPVVAVDRTGRVIFRNRAGVRELGGSDGSGAARRAGAHRALSAGERRDAEAVMHSGVPVVDQEEPDATGGVRLTTRVPVRDRAGAVVGLVAISRDVTAQKAGEARLLNDMQAAEAAARANSEFLATTSHEIRTLMSGVTGMTALLLETDLDDEQRDFVHTVRTSSDALLAIVNDVLDLSKMEAGMLELEDQPFLVRQAVEETLSMVAQQAASKGLALTFVVRDDVPDAVCGDATRLRQVLVNLLSNAIKFTDEGSVRVRVGLAPAGGSPALTFAVEDTGIGIAPDRLEAIFERFVQAEASTARTHGGSGLGLAICRRLVQMMGGEMSAESVPGGGSVFRFTVAVRIPSDDQPETVRRDLDSRPAAAQEAPVGESERPTVERDVGGTPSPLPAGVPLDELPPPGQAVVMSTDAILPSARVLLVEDDPVMQKVTTLTLRRLGYRPDVVGNGAEAVEAVLAQAYDVVLMDVMMPVMDGLEATRRIRADPGLHPPPTIVALTANAMKGDRQRCLDAGCDDYLAKPVAPRLLAATVERAIRSGGEASVDA